MKRKRQELIICTIQRYRVDVVKGETVFVKYGEPVNTDPVLCGLLGGAEACIKEVNREITPPRLPKGPTIPVIQENPISRRK